MGAESAAARSALAAPIPGASGKRRSDRKALRFFVAQRNGVPSSNFSAAQLDEAVATAKRIGVAGFVATQEQYSLLVRGLEREVLPAIERNGLGLVPYFPLASGMLSGKYRKGSPPPAVKFAPANR